MSEVSSVQVQGANVLTGANLNQLASKETALKRIGREIKANAKAIGMATKTTVGGAMGLALMGAGLYVGSLGGAAFLGFLGGGIGLVKAAIVSKGLLGFLGSAFVTTGLMSKLGIALGGVSTGLGGFMFGRKVGETAGGIPGGMVGAAIGLGKGVVKELERAMGVSENE